MKCRNMSEKIIFTSQGLLKGKTGTDINGRTYYAFQGIPYAKPPLGELRFKAPQPAGKWSGILDATKDGSACYAREMLSRNIEGSEDCLFLNVYTPELPEGRATLKPVMVYIHGGGYTSGSNSSQVYGPDFLLTGNIVLVIINYRLGLLGFLQSDDPEIDIPGNAGCKDIIMALKWVQSNIQKFGGDRNNVTIFGESAGGAATHFLVLSPMGKGLFHKAIAQSGCVFNPWASSQSAMKNLLKVLECPYSEGKDILRYLQELPVEKILEAQDKMGLDFTADVYQCIGPVVEKVTPTETAFLCEEPLDIILNGKYNQVPLMMGYTTEEGMIFEMLEKQWNRSQIIEDFEKMIPHFLKLEKNSDLSKSIANKIKTFYFGDETPSNKNIEKSWLVYTDNLFAHGIWRSVKNHLTSSKFPIYLYRFSVDASLNFLKKIANIEKPGAAHADELGYLFNSSAISAKLQEDSIELKTIRRMVKLWTNFAKCGDPNPVESVIWKNLSKDEISVLNIGKELTSSINPDQDRMTFWDSIFDEALQN